jgi:hypothetical protein
LLTKVLLLLKNREGYAPTVHYAVLLGEEGDVQRVTITEEGFVIETVVGRVSDPWGYVEKNA